MKEIFPDKKIPIPDDQGTLSKNNFLYLKNLIMSQGLTGEEATQEAWEYQLLETALIDKANELAISVTKEEIEQYVKRNKELFESSVTEDGLEISNHKETVEGIERRIEGMGITMEQYWSEYLPEIAENQIKLQKLQEILLEEGMDTNVIGTPERMREIVSEFEQKYSDEILQFKNKLNIE